MTTVVLTLVGLESHKPIKDSSSSKKKKTHLLVFYKSVSLWSPPKERAKSFQCSTKFGNSLLHPSKPTQRFQLSIKNPNPTFIFTFMSPSDSQCCVFQAVSYLFTFLRTGSFFIFVSLFKKMFLMGLLLHVKFLKFIVNQLFWFWVIMMGTGFCLLHHYITYLFDLLTFFFYGRFF